MSDYAEIVTLKDWRVGDRWIGIGTIGPVTINGETPGNALTRIVMNFRLGQTTYTLDSDDSEITISNATTWVASVPARDSFLPRAGKWDFEIEFYQSGYDAPWTLYRGSLNCHPELS